MQQELPFYFHSLGSQQNELNYLAEVSNPTSLMLIANICLLHTIYHIALRLQLCCNRTKSGKCEGSILVNATLNYLSTISLFKAKHVVTSKYLKH